MPGPLVFTATAADFRTSVLERSLETPILLDFWAPWCGPCKTLSPTLEKIAKDFNGSFAVAKVDADQELELAQAFGVQGIPFCVLVDQGRPADAFTGALPEGEIVRFLEACGVRPAGDAPEEEEPQAADPNAPEVRMARARSAAAAGDVDGVRTNLREFPEDHDLAGAAGRLLGGVDFLEPAVADGGSTAVATTIAQARDAFLARDIDGAMALLLETVVADKGFREGLARRALLLCFVVIGEEDPRNDPFRRRLATLLY